MREIVRVLWRSKWHMLAAVVLSVGAMWYYTSQQTPIYEAASVVLIDVRQTQGNNLQVIFGTAEDRSLRNELGLLQYSTELYERVATQLHEKVKADSSLRRLPVLAALADSAKVMSRVSQLPSMVRFEPVGATDMIRIIASSTAPKEATLIANELAASYALYSREHSRSDLAASRTFLQQQLQRARTDLEAADDAYRVFMEENNLAELGTSGERLVAQVSQLDALRDQARVELHMEQTALSLLRQELERLGTGLGVRVASNAYNDLDMLDKKISELRLQAEEYYAVNPALRDNPQSDRQLSDINRRIEQFTQQKEELADRLVEQTLQGGGSARWNGELEHVAMLRRGLVEKEIHARELQTQVELLDSRINELDQGLQAIPANAVRLAQFKRARDAGEQFYLFLLDKQREAAVAAESESGYVTVVRQAGVPFSPVRPDKQQNLVLGALLGVLFGVGIALLRRGSNVLIYEPEEMRQGAYPLLGSIPQMNRYIRDAFHGKTEIELPDGGAKSTMLISVHDPWSPTTEAYRYARVRLEAESGEGEGPVQTILVTSPQPKEGKSTTAINLSIALAQSGKRTLCIEADLRKPSLHQRLHAKNSPGLADLLQKGQVFSWEEAQTDTENLYFLPAGEEVPNPGELLSSRRMASLLVYLREVFDYIVIDSPPLLLVSDALSLASQCDATIVVARSGRTDQYSLTRSLEMLSSVGAKIAGTILNQADATAANGYSSYGESSYYRAYRKNTWYAKKQ